MKKNKHVESDFSELLEEEKRRDPRFAAAFAKELDRLERARKGGPLQES